LLGYGVRLWLLLQVAWDLLPFFFLLWLPPGRTLLWFNQGTVGPVA